MKVVDTTNAEHYLWQGNCQGWRLCDHDGLSVIREAMPAGRAERRHRHARAEQVFVCLSGQLAIETDTARVVLGPDQSVTVPPGTWHVVRAETDATFLVISSPSTRDDREED